MLCIIFQEERNGSSDSLSEPSDNDQDDLSACERESSSSCSSSDEAEETWSGVLPEMISRDLDKPPPLPDARPGHGRVMQKLNSLVFWFVYFLLLWQIAFHISDHGMAWFLRFFVEWLNVVGVEISSPELAQLISIFPGSLHLLRQFLDLERDDFNKFVVCPKCTKLFEYNSCIVVINGVQCAKTCTNTYYSRGKRKTCGAKLTSKVTLNNGKTCFYPIKYFCSNSIIRELERLVQKEGFASKCEEWRKRNVGADEVADVFDGKIWQSFQTVRDIDFLKCARNYGLMLNFDFFQPMKHRKDYSVGVFYLAILNLSRRERFRWENIIVVGIVPSLNSEPKNLNEFLEPAIKELRSLWIGVKLKSALSRIPLTFRAAVLCTSSDIPATRKLCGFKSHSANLGCSKCLKQFPGEFGKKRDYSGFERNLWKPRTNAGHRQQALKLKRCKTISKSLLLGKKSGITHYSILLELDYFDVIRFSTIDPMHNLFLGTAKKMFSFWTENKIIDSKELQEIEQRIESMDVPSDIGRLPKRIVSNAGSYTAEQWKNWTIIYSLYCLKGILPDDHFTCWQSFVLGCRYVCRPALTKTDLVIADRLFLKFCTEVEKLCGKEAITPNMHLHCHLKEVILDHGPVHSFWCFSFERYNGILGSTPTNKRSVEVQIMRRLIISRYFNTNLPDLFREKFLGLCPIESDKTDNLFLAEEWSQRYAFYKISSIIPLSEDVDCQNNSGVTLPTHYKISFLDKDDLQLLLITYQIMYPSQTLSLLNLSASIQKFGSIEINSISYGSKMEPRRIRSGNILASWAAEDGKINTDKFTLLAGQVKYFFNHSLKVGDVYQNNVFASVKWYKSDENCHHYGNPIRVWKQEFLPAGPSAFLPVQRIHTRFASANVAQDNGTFKLVSSPLNRKVFV